jgi:hypothetical protein
MAKPDDAPTDIAVSIQIWVAARTWLEMGVAQSR